LRLTSIPYCAAPTAYFSAVRDLKAPVLLDSGGSLGGRYDIIAANPLTLLLREGDRSVRTDRLGNQEHIKGPMFDQIRDSISAIYPNGVDGSCDWPFAGGAIGLLGYEALHGGNHLPRKALPVLLPDVHVGVYPWAIMQDHRTQRAVLMTSAPVCDEEYNDLMRRIDDAQTPLSSGSVKPFSITSRFESCFTPEAYRAAFERVVNYIHAGDCYQVNLTQRLSAPCEGDSFDAYIELRKHMRSPFSAYIETHRGDFLCLSPERLLEVRDGIVETRPIKGTLARHADPIIDAQRAEHLRNSVKDRAENLMIVDLLRNDLSKHALTGSVKVEKLFALESYANVHHLVSVIRAKLAPDTSAVDMLRGCFPGGSITGAPKLRARQIIDEVEPELRSAYCGSVFYASACGRLDANINIRSLVRCDDRVHVWGGGGIVADSECETEYRESLLKIKPIVDALERTLPPDLGSEQHSAELESDSGG